MEIYFVRHAQSFNNHVWFESEDFAAYAKNRKKDPPLTELGQQQAQQVGQHIATPSTYSEKDYNLANEKGFGITHVYASLMVRALQTGNAIASALNLPLHGMLDIHEYNGVFHFGDSHEERTGFPGNTPEQLLGLFPNLVLPEGVAADGWFQSAIENEDGMFARAQRALKFIREQHGENDRIVMVSHGGYYQAFVNAVMGLKYGHNDDLPPSKFHFGIANTGISRIVCRDGRVGLYYLNKLTHLSAEQITY